MRINKVSFNHGTTGIFPWKIKDLELGQINLVVARNASGKSRSLSIINALARMLSAEIKPAFVSANYQAEFEHDGVPVLYSLETKDRVVVSDKFTHNGKVLLDRGIGGVGTIFAEKIGTNGSSIDFQTPDTELAAVSRLDAIQHRYLEPLSEWGRLLRFYPFGTPLGRNTLTIFTNDPSQQLNEKDPENVTALFRRGVKKFGDSFKAAIVADMKNMDYDIEDIDVAPSVGLPIGLAGQVPGELNSLFIKEKDLKMKTEQFEISQGMFRALSLFTQLNYNQFSGISGCIIIDDVGEGLDFERSCNLIKILMEKTAATSNQLIMSTNDRFVMNSVPLQYWTILQRSGEESLVINYKSHREKFEEFKFTGLNNFDFFSLDFVNDSSE